MQPAAIPTISPRAVAGLRGQPLPDRTAVLARQAEAAPDGVEKIREQSRARRCRRQCGGEELAAASPMKAVTSMRLPARILAAEGLHAEHKDEPQQHDPPRASMQARVCEEGLGIVILDGTLVSVVEYDGAPAPRTMQ